ncbi:IS30 family transposase, partial [Bradyrhizobium sp. WSM2254]|uniref:IS30 family transposase n=1 Tax=Bradyrhizobium sp. WSM2254 TaxID=1188263 RepID=UPI0018DC97D5
LMKTFFCDPHAPWQKGGIENAIGRLRRFIPRKTDLEKLPTKRFRQSVATYNNTPRKCLDFRTPAEAFSSQLLHFECESTGPITTKGRCFGRLDHIRFDKTDRGNGSWLSPGRPR